MSLFRSILLVLLQNIVLLAAPLPDTAPLTMEGDLSAQMVQGIGTFLERELAQTPALRASAWSADDSSPEAYSQSLQSRRDFLTRIVGATDQRISPLEIEFISTLHSPAKLAETPDYSIHRVRWRVFDRFSAEGLWLRPSSPAKGRVIALPDADQTSEMLVGLEMGLDHHVQFARRLAEQGLEVFVPTLISRSDKFSGNAELNRFTNQPHREWIYRQAYEMGRHIIGYELQSIFSLVDWSAAENPQLPLGVIGYGEGGLLALYAAALDSRIKSAVVSGYFNKREQLWQEPIYRNLFGLLNQLGDAEIAALIAPRSLIVEYSDPPEIKGPPPPRQGRAGAAPGVISAPERYDVEEEFQKARQLAKSFSTNFHFIYGNEGTPVQPGSDPALQKFCDSLGVRFVLGTKAPPSAATPLPALEERQSRLVTQLTAHTQDLLRDSERFRDQTFWAKLGKPSVEDWSAKSAPYKAQLWEQVLGKFTNQVKSANPRSRQVYDTEKFTAYDVVLDVFDDVFAWGVLLLPKDLKPGEKRPVVVCQHGLEGLPRDTIEGEGKTDGFHAYKAFSAKLAERGFIVFAPHNPYRGRDQFRVLQRKANPLGKSLFSIILAQHDQILNWLETLPQVDPQRIGFYGLSYGGKTAMRVPSLLDRYCLSICSADFNEWITKNVTVHSPYSYMFTLEYEMPEFNLGHTFNYAEMAALIAPRPFMVERGHDDGVAPDEWVAHEFARVRRFYTRLGIADRAEIEFFNGPHTINGVGTYEFLHKHLRWPSPQ